MTLFFALLLLFPIQTNGDIAKEPKFYSDDPVWIDHDNLDTPVSPVRIELSDFFDRFSHIFHDFGSRVWGEAENINTLDEVPDSSWFTNRHGKKKMSLKELVRGSGRGSIPDPRNIYTIFRSKDQGLTPGFHTKDENGNRYMIKFGSLVSTASEIIATKILHAVGYNVPENYILYLNLNNLQISPGTMFTDKFGDKHMLTLKEVRHQLRKFPRRSDGSLRVIASKYIPGTLLGPFRYFGARSDDPNDIIDHEQRRELRGLRLIAAWINHDDSRAQNTQDTWVEKNGEHYVRHFLLDFGSCLGSGSVGSQLPHLGFHHWMDGPLMLKNALSFGFYVPLYRKVKWPNYPNYTAVGRFESRWFDPDQWRNEYPIPAFLRMTERDAFWAAKILMRFTEEELREIVKVGQINRAEEEEYLLRTLIERQKKCGSSALKRLNPLDEFRLTSNGLEFTNLSEKYGLASQGSTYHARWKIYENTTGTYYDIDKDQSTQKTILTLPLFNFLNRKDVYLLVSIATHHHGYPEWEKKVVVYLRPSDKGFKVVGVERESNPSVNPNQLPEK